MIKKALVLSAVLFCAPSAYAETVYVPSAEYTETLCREIRNARSSIDVTMYLFSVDPEDEDSSPMRILQALTEAHGRGVRVRVLLDETYDASRGAPMRWKNKNAYDLLQKSGIEVRLDEARINTHAKVVVIDGLTVMIGSTNWTPYGLGKNREANLLTRSSEVAREVLEEFSGVEDSPPSATVTEAEAVPVSAAFVEGPSFLGGMISDADERALDVYLYFLWQSRKAPPGLIEFRYEELGSYLGTDRQGREASRRQIRKTLYKLKDQYRLLDFPALQFNQEKDQVSLASLPGEVVLFPEDYFKYRWRSRLGFPAKAMLLVLYRQSAGKGSFFISRETLSKAYQMTESFITDGTGALRRARLLDILYAELDPKTLKDRLANVYVLRKLYDPAALEKELAVLKQSVGDAPYEKARVWAAYFCEENNPSALRDLLDAERRYGPDLMTQAAQKVTTKRPDNPKRSLRYFLRTLEGMAKSGSGG